MYYGKTRLRNHQRSLRCPQRGYKDQNRPCFNYGVCLRSIIWIYRGISDITEISSLLHPSDFYVNLTIGRIRKLREQTLKSLPAWQCHVLLNVKGAHCLVLRILSSVQIEMVIWLALDATILQGWDDLDCRDSLWTRISLYGPCPYLCFIFNFLCRVWCDYQFVHMYWVLPCVYIHSAKEDFQDNRFHIFSFLLDRRISSFICWGER